MMEPARDVASDRARLERLLGADLRDLTSESDWIVRSFAQQNDVSANEFRALLFVMIAEAKGIRLTAGELRRQMSLSGAAITYLVERMTSDGHLRRETDPADRRKVILRHSDRGVDVARAFFRRLTQHNHVALAALPDSDLEAAHRTFVALVAAMKDFRAQRPVPVDAEVCT
jgi:MarR family transcriptional regulator, organic hydroperoxide resistance regulator